MNIDYLIYLLTSVAIWVIAGVSYQVSIGFAGIMNLGFVALMGIGGYAYALLIRAADLNPSISLALACIAPIPFALLLSFLTKLVRGDYLALMTLWFSLVITILLMNLESITRGALGIPGIIRPAAISQSSTFAFFAAACAALLSFFAIKLQRSPLGTVMAALRDDELAAQTFGKNTFRVKIIAFVLSSIGAGFSGALLAMFLGFIDPVSFYLPQLIIVLTFVIVGGLASVPGIIIAATGLTLLPELLRFLPFPTETVGALRAIIYSLILLIIILYRPKGILG